MYTYILLTCCSRPVPFWLIALLILSSNQLLFFSCFPFRKIFLLLRFFAFYWCTLAICDDKKMYMIVVFVLHLVSIRFSLDFPTTSYVPQATAFSSK